MRILFVWTRPSQTSLRVLCACCALWGAPAAALAAAAQVTPTPAVPTSTAAAERSAGNDSTARVGTVLFDRRVLALLVMGCVVGLVVSWSRGGPPDIRFRLLNKPKKTQLSVLVPPGPAPRLIPSESPNATRARAARSPVPRPAPVSATRPGIIHYIAAFADPAKASERVRVDYLLVSGDSADESPDSPDGSDDSPAS
jgi:hypothetical protein